MQGPYIRKTTQHRKTQTYIHDTSRIRTRDSIVRAVEDSTRLRPRRHWDRQLIYQVLQFSMYVTVDTFYSPLDTFSTERKISLLV
jgi:hypothetical protein